MLASRLFELFLLAFFEVVASHLLAPGDMSPAAPRLYNMMHYGRMPGLAAMVLWMAPQVGLLRACKCALEGEAITPRRFFEGFRAEVAAETVAWIEAATDAELETPRPMDTWREKGVLLTPWVGAKKV